eukprot:CAMPEP_0202697184 /NCGR_PEP_ID=MMETSP1385-20130828/10506_1 /ASSEMBLY_ACC=CAM_ASM_000861 /TAXON_ID=933848 /ORGANISM="Elphidium margaritaceum" /LENGTH=171 /DNA_ID=CAMNT_0049353567 /DNA_START=72 /DNA_END=587 /DNA_ORIENTATION=-
MNLALVVLALCLYAVQGLKSDFATQADAEKYVSEFLVFEDHLSAGNVNENFEFIQMYISKDFVYCLGSDCVEGRDEYIKSLNSLGGIVKEWVFTCDVQDFGNKYLRLFTLRTTTFGNGEKFTLPATATVILNEDGSWKYWIANPVNTKYQDKYRAVLERNAGIQVQKKEDL